MGWPISYCHTVKSLIQAEERDSATLGIQLENTQKLT